MTSPSGTSEKRFLKTEELNEACGKLSALWGRRREEKGDDVPLPDLKGHTGILLPRTEERRPRAAARDCRARADPTQRARAERVVPTRRESGPSGDGRRQQLKIRAERSAVKESSFIAAFRFR